MITSGRALSIAEMILPAALMRSGVSRMVIALVRGQRRDAARVDDDAEDVDRFLEVGVAQIEGAVDLFLVLAPLRLRVGHDDDAAVAGGAPEVARGRRELD